MGNEIQATIRGCSDLVSMQTFDKEISNNKGITYLSKSRLSKKQTIWYSQAPLSRAYLAVRYELEKGLRVVYLAPHFPVA